MPNSVPVNISDIQEPVFVSVYTGQVLPGLPTFSTPTDDPTGRIDLFMEEF